MISYLLGFCFCRRLSSLTDFYPVYIYHIICSNNISGIYKRQVRNSQNSICRLHSLLPIVFLIITILTKLQILLRNIICNLELVSSFPSLHLKNRKQVSCFHRVIETQVEVWENKNCCGNTNFHECFYNSVETQSTVLTRL